MNLIAVLIITTTLSSSSVSISPKTMKMMAMTAMTVTTAMTEMTAMMAMRVMRVMTAMKTGKTRTGKMRTGKMKTGTTKKTGKTRTGTTKTGKESVETLLGLRTCLVIASMRNGSGKTGSAAITSQWSPFKSRAHPACKIATIATEFGLSQVSTTGLSRTLGAQNGVKKASFVLRSPMTRWASPA